jgi:hypothetical protein
MLDFCFIRLPGNGDCEPISDLSPSSFAAPAHLLSMMFF